MTEMLLTPKVLVVPCAESEMKWYRRPPPPWAAYMIRPADGGSNDGGGSRWPTSTGGGRARGLHRLHSPDVLLCRAWDPDCTVQTCSLRDVAAKLGDVAIVGMKPDPVERLADALLGDD
jgi:hypothetical protein